MPTALRVGGLRFVVYPNDHTRAHIHVRGPGWDVVVTLDGPAVREIVGACSDREARRILDLVREHQAVLLEAWRRIHG